MAEHKTTLTTRLARPGDTVALHKLLLAAYSDADAPYPPVDEHRLLAWIADTLDQGEVWVTGLSGRVLGSIGLAGFQFPWSREFLLSNRWLYVDPAFRARGFGRYLIQAAIASADDKNTGLIIGTHSGRDPDWKDDFLGRFEGMVYGGGTFFRAAQGGDAHG